MRYFILNKPPGCLSARSDPARGRATIYDHVPPHFPRLPHVGRLDYNSEGLMLFTDDGRLAQALLGGLPPRDPDDLPRRKPEKRYEVKVRGHLSEDDPLLTELAEPYTYRDGTVTAPARVRFLDLRARATWVEFVIAEGRNRQIRRLCQRSGLQVVKLRRVAFGPLALGELKMRWCRPLTPAEVAACYEAALPGEPRPEHEPIDNSPEAYARARSS